LSVLSSSPTAKIPLKEYDLFKYDSVDAIQWRPGNKILLVAHGWHDAWNGWMRKTRDFGKCGI